MLDPPQPLGPRSQGFRGECAMLLMERSPRAVDAMLDFGCTAGGHTKAKNGQVVLRVQVGTVDANSGGAGRTPGTELSRRDP